MQLRGHLIVITKSSGSIHRLKSKLGTIFSCLSPYPKPIKAGHWGGVQAFPGVLKVSEGILAIAISQIKH